VLEDVDRAAHQRGRGVSPVRPDHQGRPEERDVASEAIAAVVAVGEVAGEELLRLRPAGAVVLVDVYGPVPEMDSRVLAPGADGHRRRVELDRGTEPVPGLAVARRQLLRLDPARRLQLEDVGGADADPVAVVFRASTGDEPVAVEVEREPEALSPVGVGCDELGRLRPLSGGVLEEVDGPAVGCLRSVAPASADGEPVPGQRDGLPERVAVGPIVREELRGLVPGRAVVLEDIDRAVIVHALGVLADRPDGQHIAGEIDRDAEVVETGLFAGREHLRLAPLRPVVLEDVDRACGVRPGMVPSGGADDQRVALERHGHPGVVLQSWIGLLQLRGCVGRPETRGQRVLRLPIRLARCVGAGGARRRVGTGWEATDGEQRGEEPGCEV